MGPDRGAAMPGTHYHYRCAECRRIFPPIEFLARCPECRGVLLIKQEIASRVDSLRTLFNGIVTDMWKYAPLLPVKSFDESKSLKEGGRPSFSRSPSPGRYTCPGSISRMRS